MHIYGKDRFVDTFTTRINKRDYLINDADFLLLKLEEDKKQRYIESKSKNIIVHHTIVDNIKYKIGVLFAEQYISELGNTLLETKTDLNLDCIAIINPSIKTVSYRSIRDDINVGLVAKHFGGGGHPRAAGNQIDDKIILSFVGDIL